jgi:hypothetical protein
MPKARSIDSQRFRRESESNAGPGIEAQGSGDAAENRARKTENDTAAPVGAARLTIWTKWIVGSNSNVSPIDPAVRFR